jgi:arylsulfatase A
MDFVKIPVKYLRRCVGQMRVSGYLRTPGRSTDALATESAVLSQFYAASSVCTPSRAALLTGQPTNKGMCHEKEHIFSSKCTFSLGSNKKTAAVFF